MTEAISPDMVLDKAAYDGGTGIPVGRIVDVGLFDHSRVKFLVVAPDEDDKTVPIRRYGVDDIDSVSADAVTLRVRE